MHTRGPRTISLVALIGFLLLWQSTSLAQTGRLERLEISSAHLENLIGDETTRPLNVYLPPTYDSSGEAYPTVYVLHGFLGNAGSMTGIIPVIDSMVESGAIGEMIYVFPDGSNRFKGSMYAASETIGDYESYLVEDIASYVDSNFRTLAHRSSRGITGFSMGGWGSMRYALKYPEMFSVVVPQAGAYDTDSEWWRGLSSTAATANPADWSAYNGVFVFSQFVFAISAGANPNPGNPPFYLDLAYELVDGAPQLVPERWEKQLSQDCVNGLLDAYLNQPVALAGIKVVHGTSDAVIPVSQARTVHEIFGNRGIEHVYVEHAGGHEFVPEESLQFLGDNLSWQQTPSAIAIETWGDVKAAHRE